MILKSRALPAILSACLLLSVLTPALQAQCERTITADVVAFDQVFSWNRFGAIQPQGMMFALRRDVGPITGTTLAPGNVELRPDKRPRPIVLRMNVGDCLKIHFQNLLATSPVDDEQAATRDASVHVIGMQLVDSMLDDGTNVGANSPGAGPSGLGGLVSPGDSITYTLYAEREGTHVLHSAAATTGGEGDGGQLNSGLFGAVNVEPRDSRWYRSQVTGADLELALDTASPNSCASPATPGYTCDGHPIIDYEALYPTGHPKEGTPILELMCPTATIACAANEIVHTDLTALITGRFTGRLDETGVTSFGLVNVLRDRSEPFREFTIMYHDEIGAVQAFPEFEDPVLEHTLASVRDAFAHNYGTGGLGAELLASRMGVGPVDDCPECKYEEFFLSSWTVGDPAMVVDKPASSQVPGDPTTRATTALYPDDPSNVYHSYLSDHVKFRILHGGSKEHHIHHQHAHQWIFSEADEGAYLDSQALGPGASFTLDMVYDGSGNRNLTAGDSLFHCHFYPHFAQGMWSLWRVHDVLEKGTEMDGLQPAVGSAGHPVRALPDGEIARGTPIPAVVPLPTKAMPPLPEADVWIEDGQVKLAGAGNPGYPFFIPGQAGNRAPHPPLDKVADWGDGGLPRHVVVDSDNNGVKGTFFEVHNRLDMTKELLTLDVQELPEAGTAVEQAAMAYHAIRNHASFKPDGTPGNFLANGLPAAPGAPFADPCVSDTGIPIGSARLYRAADIQVDAVFNKVGWHFPQQRMLALWGDVMPTLNGERPPEPLFFRANTNDCIQYELTNLVPNVYEMDDFQVRTPTDVLGQHIHLVKFDVTSSDGAANGFNYEDGSFSPDEVRERVAAIRAYNGCTTSDPRNGTIACPQAKVHPFFGEGPGGKWIGAQTNIQRWFADDVLNLVGKDRTLRTVFTHDHFSPSTHQEAGLYAGLVIEPEGSSWRDPATSQLMGSRTAMGPTGYMAADGGPTGWKADILTGLGGADSYREFLFEFQDFQLAYEGGGGDLKTFAGVTGGLAHADPAKVINPPAKDEPGLPFLVERAVECPGGAALPCPEAIAAEDPGTMSINYRNEPLALRVYDPVTGGQAAGDAGDFSLAFRSDITRAIAELNSQPDGVVPGFPTISLNPQALPGDPYTPLMRVYPRDKVQVRLLVGANEEGHNFFMHGQKWFFEPDVSNSGFRNSQMMGISEHFEFEAPVQRTQGQLLDETADYLYGGGSVDDLWNGLWGIMRSYRTAQPALPALPNNPAGGPSLANSTDFNGPCPKTAPTRSFDITAVTAADVLPGGTLVYNDRGVNGGPLHDPTAIMFVRTSDLDVDGKLKPGVGVEPLILRAAAGECISVLLRNNLPETPPDLAGFRTLVFLIDGFNSNEVHPSNRVGLHPQLVAYDVTKSDGAEIGVNPTQTAAPGEAVQYLWYAGDLKLAADGTLQATPVEFGATGLSSSDRINHSNKGAVGALIIEPENSSWVEDTYRSSATVFDSSGNVLFRDFALIFQNDINMRCTGCGSDPSDADAVPNLADTEDAEDAGQKAFNYRTEPMWLRKGFAPDTPLSGEGGMPGPATRDFIFSEVLTNAQVGGDPVTPLFVAEVGAPVRFRVVQPAGVQRNGVFTVDGHIWNMEPYSNDSTLIGDNPKSFWTGARSGIGPTDHFDAVLKNGAGGKFGVTGDYLYRTFESFNFDGGQWGIFRVGSGDSAVPLCSGPGSGAVGIQDGGIGLASIQVIESSNATVDVPLFRPGTKTAVTVTAAVINPDADALAVVDIYDAAGNHSTCTVLDVTAAPLSPVQPGDLLASSGDNLADLDEATGAGAVRFAHGGAVGDLDFRSSDSSLFAGTTGGQLTTVDPDTGAETAVGAPGNGFQGMAFAGDLLFATRAGSTGSDLVRVDPATGADTLIGTLTGLGQVNGLAFEWNSCLLYGASSAGDFFSVDPNTNAFTDIGSTAAMSSLRFAPNGTLFGGTLAGDLVTINPASGAATTVGASGFADLTGLGWVPGPAADLDGDGDVDRDDMMALYMAFRARASACVVLGVSVDPRDINGNGLIDIGDVRAIMGQCTRPRCATQ